MTKTRFSFPSPFGVHVLKIVGTYDEGEWVPVCFRPLSGFMF